MGKVCSSGTRGFDGGNSDGLYTAVPMVDYIAHANRETLIILQLEDERAVAQAEAIAAVPGVDVLMFGPADFTILGGFAGEFDHPKVGRSNGENCCRRQEYRQTLGTSGC